MYNLAANVYTYAYVLFTRFHCVRVCCCCKSATKYLSQINDERRFGHILCWSLDGWIVEGCGFEVALVNRRCYFLIGLQKRRATKSGLWRAHLHETVFLRGDPSRNYFLIQVSNRRFVTGAHIPEPHSLGYVVRASASLHVCSLRIL